MALTSGALGRDWSASAAATAAVVDIGVDVDTGIAASGETVVANAGAIGVDAVAGAALAVDAGAMRIDAAVRRTALRIAIAAMIVVVGQRRQAGLVTGTGVEPRLADVAAHAAGAGR